MPVALGIDVGERRIGVSRSDGWGLLATPVTTVLRPVAMRLPGVVWAPGLAHPSAAVAGQPARAAVTTHPAARIVGIALGHDERVHDHQAFKTILANAVTWAARVK